MKLSLEDKKEIVRLYFEDGLGCRRISKKYNLNDSTVKRIIKKYKVHGSECLIHPPKNHKYSPEFKESIIKQVYEGKSKTSLAAQYGLSGPGAIVAWIHKYEDFGYNGLIVRKRGRLRMEDKKIINDNTKIDLSSPLTNEERAEFEELKKKYKLLEKEKELSDMENKFLKKLDALVQERLKRGRKK